MNRTKRIKNILQKNLPNFFINIIDNSHLWAGIPKTLCRFYSSMVFCSDSGCNKTYAISNDGRTLTIFTWCRPFSSYSWTKYPMVIRAACISYDCCSTCLGLLVKSRINLVVGDTSACSILPYSILCSLGFFRRAFPSSSKSIMILSIDDSFIPAYIQ